MQRWFGVLVFCMGMVFFSVSGYAAAISGMVTDEATGEALAQAAVYLYEVTDENGLQDKNLVNLLYTDDNGDFQFQNLTGGDYTLKVAYQDKIYFSEYYDDLKEVDEDLAAIIALEDDANIVLNPIELRKRPFYFGRITYEPADLMQKGGRGKVIAEVINTTDQASKIRFWAIAKVTQVQHPQYYNCDSYFPISKLRRRYTVMPGENEVKIEITVPEAKTDSTRIQISINGGESFWDPMLKASSDFIYRSLVRNTPVPAESTPVLRPVNPLPTPIPLEPINEETAKKFSWK